MAEDIFPAAEKILTDIENIFKKDINKLSFEIIPVNENKNKSPIFYDENSLGLASWCIQPLYCYVYNRLMDLRQNLYQREEPKTISRWLLGALLLNPDVLTFWNMRRQLLQNERLDPLKELNFLDAVIYFKAKCFEAFSYRRSVLQLILINKQRSIHDAEQILRNELSITLLASERYKNNCHAWSHREQIILMLEKKSLKILNTLLIEEWEELTKWCSNHISDYSGFSYRQFLLKKLLLRTEYPEKSMYINNINERKKIVFEFIKNVKEFSSDVLHNNTDEEILNLLHGVNSAKSSELSFEHTLINLSYWVEDCINNEELIYAFPGHEALWYHRRFLVVLLITLCNSYDKYYAYRAENLNPFDAITMYNKSNKNLDLPIINKNSLLNTAFLLRNKKLMFAANKYKDYNNDLAEKFFNFLVCLQFNI